MVKTYELNADALEALTYKEALRTTRNKLPPFTGQQNTALTNYLAGRFNYLKEDILAGCSNLVKTCCKGSGVL